ncbi:MAG: polynucleotide adenylyltransferase PcnB [Panacagrimonas sp.]
MSLPRRYPRAEHPISRSNLSSGALKTLYTLKDAGFQAYLVGGGVRDLLAGLQPKDFDIATDAHPEQVKALFRSCRLIGRRFVICHVRFGGEVLEVTTFRGPITDGHERDDTGRILSDNDYGTLEEDAFRRDFTVNALYYDIRDYAVVDFCDGVGDLNAGVLRLIGDPELRYREDPVRMLRAIRIANKLKYRLDEATAAPIARFAALLNEVPPARLFDEVLKVLMNPQAADNLYGMRVYGLFAQLFPQTDALLEQPPVMNFIMAALNNTAKRIEDDLPVSPAFLYATLLWPAVEQQAQELTQTQGHNPAIAMAQAGEAVIARAVHRVAIPKRFSVPMREIWDIQVRLTRVHGSRPKRLMTHPRFRAAYDFLLLRAPFGDAGLQALAQWWTQAQQDAELPPLTEELNGVSVTDAPTRKRRRRGGRRRNASRSDAAQPSAD